MPMKPGVKGWAEFSEEKPPRCRFALGRTWDPSKGIAFYSGLNPSRAGADNDDMTVTKGMGFARVWGLGGTIHVNAFPFITPYPSMLRHCTEVEIARNDRRMLELAAMAKVVVLAWGAFSQFKERFRMVARMLAPYNPICLGRTADGFPKHISRIGYDSPREPWQSAAVTHESGIR